MHPKPYEKKAGALAPKLVEALEASSLFRGVDLVPLGPLLEECGFLELQPGQELIRSGDTDSRVFIVLEGELEVHLDSSREQAVAILRAGDSVGEIAALDRKPRSAGVMARGRARVLAIDMEDFWLLLGRSHQLSLNLLNVLSQRLRGNNAAILESRKLQAQYRRHATMDALTGLLNRRGLDEVAIRLAKRLGTTKKDLCVLMIDVDHFKRFNDEHGHQAGDQVLHGVAQLLKARLRPTDVVARYGGEEFTALLPDTDLEGAAVAAERLRSAVEECRLTTEDGQALPPVTVSIGLTVVRAGDFSDAVARADAALYASKRSGRNRVTLAGGELRPG